MSVSTSRKADKAVQVNLPLRDKTKIVKSLKQLSSQKFFQSWPNVRTHSVVEGPPSIALQRLLGGDDDVKHDGSSAPDVVIDRLMSYARREARLVLFLRDYRLRVENLSKQTEKRAVEFRRLKEERGKLCDELVVSRGRAREMTSVVDDLHLCLCDLRAKCNEEMTMQQLKDVERRETVDKLTWKICQLTNENRRLTRRLESLSSLYTVE